MSSLMLHGGLYTLTDGEMMQRRFNGIMTAMAAEGAHEAAMAEARVMMSTAKSVPTFFFYHMVSRPYGLASQLVSYLSYPARHLASPTDPTFVPVPPPAPSPTAPPFDTDHPVYTQQNDPSTNVPAAATFIGQFIDHDLTLNAVNLLDAQRAEVRSQASPLIDLDSVYGPRIDDGGAGNREVPMKDGYFCLAKIPDSDAYDVCRSHDKSSDMWRALIGDKRNDENQLILQVHILAMRLHNHFRHKLGNAAAAKRETILHWQAMVATYYLPLVVRHEAIAEVIHRLFHAPQTMCHRPGLTICGGCTLGMPHEFAIGFRFGHSQLRSEYKLSPDHPALRLFDSRGVTIPSSPFHRVPAHDLQGSKKLVASHVIDWRFFSTQVPANEIDTKVTEDVFDLPGSAIPDDVKLVNNLPLRNLIRSDGLGLCAGEDLADHYVAAYGARLPVRKMLPTDVEPRADYRPLFQLAQIADEPPSQEFRTPLWFYLLREAEVDRASYPAAGGRLGMVGSLMVAEVLLSGMRYADPAESIFQVDPWKQKLAHWKPADGPLVSLIDLVEMIEESKVEPPACAEAVHHDAAAKRE